jgi:hypothetical protein
VLSVNTPRIAHSFIYAFTVYMRGKPAHPGSGQSTMLCATRCTSKELWLFCSCTDTYCKTQCRPVLLLPQLQRAATSRLCRLAPPTGLGPAAMQAPLLAAPARLPANPQLQETATHSLAQHQATQLSGHKVAAAVWAVSNLVLLLNSCAWNMRCATSRSYCSRCAAAAESGHKAHAQICWHLRLYFN